MKTRLRLSILGVCLVSLLWLSLGITAADQTRVVAIGDVHGAYTQFSAILQQTGLISGNSQWMGRSATLIQIGDILDRGHQSRACLDLLMNLEKQADRLHGRVVFLLGNHEIMNMMGDLRYVTAEEYRNFASDRSGKLVEQNYRDYLKFVAVHSGHAHTTAAENEATRQAWIAGHPPGFFEYRDSMGPGGKYGRWLRKHDAIVQVGDGLFLHGGLNPGLQFGSIAELNERIRNELADFDSIWRSLSDKRLIWRYMTLEEATAQVAEELRWIKASGQIEDPDAAQQMQKLLGLPSWVSVSPDGPLWYRGLAEEPEEKLQAELKALLARLQVRYIVVGHTPSLKSVIISRFDNHVFLIDTGMLKEVYRGVASALEIQDGRFTADYLDGKSQALESPAGTP